MLSQVRPGVGEFPVLGRNDRTFALPGAANNRAKSLIGERIHRLVEPCGTRNAASSKAYVSRFRRQICADCEYYGDPDCACPLMALPFTTEGHKILEREERERAIQPRWYYDQLPETD